MTSESIQSKKDQLENTKNTETMEQKIRNAEIYLCQISNNGMFYTGAQMWLND